MNRIDFERLTSLLRLDADTGQLHWKEHRQSGAAPGDVAGWLDVGRYIRVEVDGVRLSAHRVAWALHHGHWPPDDRQVDHINGYKTDNRPANLRLATNSQNQVNTPVRPGTRSGLKGVDWINRVGKWRAKIMVNKVNIHIGYFSDKHEAHAAYCAHAASLHGQYTHPESVKPNQKSDAAPGVANG
ncbi:HNH endonuclease signature motif containing protein [Stenotrophomonas sp. AS1]|uniref:HNH endonuclease signature motif containing protein n=1 Tax=Stenotrophomonas sp. AS1 TaxID=3029188 RepID=UPI003B7BFE4F